MCFDDKHESKTPNNIISLWTWIITKTKTRQKKGNEEKAIQYLAQTFCHTII
jgi:hypothetical protein